MDLPKLLGKKPFISNIEKQPVKSPLLELVQSFVDKYEILAEQDKDIIRSTIEIHNVSRSRHER